MRTAAHEALAGAFGQPTLLPLADCRHALQETMPPLWRATLPRCCQRQGVRRLPLGADALAAAKKAFQDSPLGYLPVGFAQGLAEEGRQELSGASERPSKVAFAQRPPQAKRVVAAELWRRVREQVPCRVPTGLPDNGLQCPPPPHQPLPGGPSFDRVGRALGVAPRLAQPAHPRTNGQGARFNRPQKAAPLPRYHCQATAELPPRLPAFWLAGLPAQRLQPLRGLPSHERSCAQGHKNPVIFTRDPTQLTRELYT